MSLENLVKEPPEPLIAQPLFNDIRHAITEKTEAQDLIFEDIEPIAGFQIATSLYEDREIEQIHPSVHYNSVTKVLRVRVKSTAVLDCHNGWMHDELFRMYPAFLTKLEFRFLNTWTSTTLQSFVGPYNLSSKDPGLCLRPKGQRFPTIVVETGWSETWPYLKDDAILWLCGSGRTVQLVIVLCWSLMDGRKVNGDIKVFERDADGNPVFRQTESIFPMPVAHQSQVISITRSQLFGDAVLLGRNGDDAYHLSVDNLRQEAARSIQAVGFTPA